MILDSSALIALVLDEAEAPAFRVRVAADPVRLASSATIVEASMVMLSRNGEAGLTKLRDLIAVADIQIVALDASHIDLAVDAFRRFGKGRHPSGLNFGDCLSYALARATGEKLLFKGNDFARTDIAAA